MGEPQLGTAARSTLGGRGPSSPGCLVNMRRDERADGPMPASASQCRNQCQSPPWSEGRAHLGRAVLSLLGSCSLKARSLSPLPCLDQPPEASTASLLVRRATASCLLPYLPLRLFLVPGRFQQLLKLLSHQVLVCARSQGGPNAFVKQVLDMGTEMSKVFSNRGGGRERRGQGKSFKKATAIG